MPTPQCVLYLRSSKDRHDVSLVAQRRQLETLAAERKLLITHEYADAVESGKDEDRPGFQGLLRDLRDPGRAWSAILALDTSRIARRRHLAIVFEHQAEKAGIQIIYRSVPDTDPITAMLLRSILQAMDEWHSLTSKAKGLAGQAENIRQGWRAGGRAPRGYALEQVLTGAVRDGAPVSKSRLVPGAEAVTVAAYLRARAAGQSRTTALTLAGAEWPYSSLYDIELRALIYAGHTVWGQSADGKRRRPRAEWTIQRETHEALISEREAEAILAQLERQSSRRTRQHKRSYLLSGLLVSPEGQNWAAEWDVRMQAPIYRLKRSAKVSGRRIEAAVIDAVFADLAAPQVAERIAEAMRRQSDCHALRDDQNRLTAKVEELSRQIGKLVDLAIDADDPAPYRRAISRRERERHLLVAERNDLANQEARAREARKWKASHVRHLLQSLRAELENQKKNGDISALRTALQALVDRIEYQAGNSECSIHYRLNTGLKLASPRGAQPSPVTWNRTVALPMRHARKL